MELDEIILDKDIRKKFLDLKESDYAYDTAFFIPQCLRSDYCEAESNDGVVECTSCYTPRRDGEKCIAGQVKDKLENLFKDKHIRIYILRGGSVLPKLLTKYGKPKIVVGIACPIEINQAEQLLKHLNIKPQVIPLVQDGCSETKFDQKIYNKVIKSLI